MKLHADQLSDGAGAALVAEFGGLSADHVEHTSEAGVRAMAAAGTVAVLLPGAFHCLRETTLPLGEIALQTGWCDQSAFTRHFSRYAGMAPGKFRAIQTDRSQ